MAAALDALVRAIGSCTNAEEIEALINWPHVKEWFPLSSELLGPVVDAMVGLADVLGQPSEAASVLGWAVWASQPSPIAVVYPGFVASHNRAEACQPAFAAHAPLYRRWLNDLEAERRAAGAYALVWCAGTSPADVRALLDGAGRESDAHALSSALVALATLARRLDADIEAVRALARRTLSHADAFARACGAAALALLGEALSSEATTALVDVVLQPVALPASWGWRTSGRAVHGSDSFACAVLNWAPTRAAEDAVRALALVELPFNPAAEAKLAALRAHVGEDAYRDALRAKWQHAGPCESLIMGALGHLAFEARGYSSPPYGLVVSELDLTQRVALEAMGRRTPQAPWIFERIGFNATAGDPDIVSDFLAGTTPEWRPISVTIDGRACRWHFGAIWCATVLGMLTVSAAADAIVAATTPAEAVDLVTRFEASRKPAYDRLDDQAGWERDQELALAVIDAAVARGFDLEDMMKAVASNQRTGLPAIASVAYLRARPIRIPAEHWAVIADGLEQTRVPEPLESLAAAARAGREER